MNDLFLPKLLKIPRIAGSKYVSLKNFIQDLFITGEMRTSAPTIYTADGSIDGLRIVTIDSSTGGLSIADPAGDNYMNISTLSSNFEVEIQKSDYFQPDSGSDLYFQMQGDRAQITLNNTGVGTIEVDPEDPASYYRAGYESSFTLTGGLNPEININITKVGSVNSLSTEENGGLYASPTDLILNRRQLKDISDGENTFVDFTIGDLASGFGYEVVNLNPDTLFSLTEGYGGYSYTNAQSTYLGHETLNSSASAIYLSANNAGLNESVDLRLTTDLDSPLFQRSTGDGNSHSIVLSTVGMETAVQTFTSSGEAYIEFATNNSLGTSSSFGIGQAPEDESSLSAFYAFINNADETIEMNLVMTPHDFTLTSNGVPTEAAILRLNSSTQGFLPPRLTTTERDNIPTPVAGLMIYNVTTGKLNVFTTVWEQVTSA